MLENNFAVYYIPGAIFVAGFSGVSEIHLAVFDVPPAAGVAVVRNAGVAELNFAADDIPPAVVAFGNGIGGKVHLAVFDVPPAVVVLIVRNAGVVCENLAALHIVPVAFRADGAFHILDYAVFLKCYVTIFDVPNTVFVLLEAIVAILDYAVYIVSPCSGRSLAHAVFVVHRNSAILISAELADETPCCVCLGRVNLMLLSVYCTQRGIAVAVLAVKIIDSQICAKAERGDGLGCVTLNAPYIAD